MVIAKVGTLRTFLPQFIASSSKNCILIISGLVVSLPTVIVPALTKSDDELHLTFYQASWFASMVPMLIIMGTLISGAASHMLGRKRAMLLATVPHIIGLTTLYFAKSVTVVFIAMSVMGFGIGLGESSISTYVSEISEPNIRGILLAIGSIMVQVGGLIIFTLGSFVEWRMVVLLCIILPYLAAFLVLIIPEAPSWLLSKNRKKDAQKSLQWLRGWVSAQHVEKELNELEHHVEISKKCRLCEKNNIACSHPEPILVKRIVEMLRRRNLSVFFIVIMLFLLDYGIGALAMRPFMIQIMRAYGVAMDPHKATIIIGIACVLAKLLSVAAIKFLGKRGLALVSLVTTLACLIGLAIYAELRLPPNWTSFVSPEDVQVELSYIPLVLYVLYYFFCHFGIQTMPWLTLCEMFPFKSRCLCTSVAIALGQVISFSATKCYIYLEVGFALSGAMWFFSAVCFAGIFLVYFLLPESEGVSMTDIEAFFSDNTRRLTDVHMGKFLQKRRQNNENAEEIQKNTN